MFIWYMGAVIIGSTSLSSSLVIISASFIYYQALKPWHELGSSKKIGKSKITEALPMKCKTVAFSLVTEDSGRKMGRVQI